MKVVRKYLCVYWVGTCRPLFWYLDPSVKQEIRWESLFMITVMWVCGELFICCWNKSSRISIGLDCQGGIAGMKRRVARMKILYSVWFRLDKSKCLVVDWVRRESLILSIELCATKTSKCANEISWWKDRGRIPASAQILMEGLARKALAHTLKAADYMGCTILSIVLVLKLRRADP